MTNWQGLMCTIGRNSTSSKEGPHSPSVPRFVADDNLIFSLGRILGFTGHLCQADLGFLGALVLISSIWLQFIWLAVGSTVKTRDLVKLNNNSIPTAPTNLLNFTAFVLV